MRILLTVGHSVLKNGNYTSADGRPFGGVLEYEFNKSIVGKLATYLREAGHGVKVLICPERQFTKASQEKEYKLSEANSGKYDLVAELHLNASQAHTADGCEVLYISEEGKKIALRVQERLSTVFRNRGIQKRDNLYMLSKVKPVAIMLESFFCDNKSDCEKAKKTDVALLIAEGIHGGTIKAHTQEEQQQITEKNNGYLFRFRKIVSSLTIRKGPGTEYDAVDKITDSLVYTIIETAKAKDGGTWGKLKSGIGWVNVGSSYVNRI